MKKIIRLLAIGIILSYCNQTAQTLSSKKTTIYNTSPRYKLIKNNFNKLNRLNWIEITENKLSSQILLDFAQPIYYQLQKKILKKETLLLFIFPGMTLNNFDKNQIIGKINKLKKNGLIKDVKIKENNITIPSVILTIYFNKYQKNKYQKNINKTHNKKQKITNKLLIKCNKMEDPNRLFIDIFTEETLKNIEQKNKVLLQAKNTNSPDRGYLNNKTNIKNLRIVLDPGHGGKDSGAINKNGTQEKDITLRIARKVRSLLRKSGHKVLLTRNTDKKMTLTQRSELAAQLQADLFVSIHVNSYPIPNNKISGIETFYLDGKNLTTPSNQVRFFFVNQQFNKHHASIANNHLKNNIYSSKKLASDIQKHLIHSLYQKKYTVIDRGVKSSVNRVLLQSQVPAALIEVGFISNKQEAARLTSNYYQNIIAQGISVGIKANLSTR